MKNLARFLVLMIAVVTSAQIHAQSVENVSILTIEKIMKGEDFVGYSPTNIQWSDDSKTIYFDWNPNKQPLRRDRKSVV